MLFGFGASAQLCVVDAGPDTVWTDCGQPTYLSAIGLSSTPALSTDFDGGAIGAGWSATGTVLYNNPCGPSLDGTPSAWFGNVPFPRTLTTNGFDLSCGGQVCFDLDFGGDENSTDCEDPDQVDEGVYFRYSIDGGATWVDIFYFEPTSNISGPYYDWANYCFTLPAAAWTANTMFQWHQNQASSTTYDHWGIDNVEITPTNCGYWYDWDNLAPAVDNFDQTVNPGSTSTYIVTYTDGVDACYDTITVAVNPVTADVTASLTTLTCPDCSDLDVQFTNYANGSLVDDFNGSINSSAWNDMQGGAIGGGCGSMSGFALAFNGSGPDRYAESYPFDATACGTIDFCLYMGNTGSGLGCDNVDLGEDVVLEYSVNGGVTWTTISTYDQSLWDANNAWQCFNEAIPMAAQTATTIVRWRQLAFDNNADGWALDNVSLICTPPPFTYSWSPAIGLNDPTIQSPQSCPQDPVTYVATITDPATGCSASDSISLAVSCFCMYPDFTANVSDCENGNEFTVSGDFSYVESPLTGSLIVEVTNASGTYSQTFLPPFTDGVLQNYSIGGVISDGSPVTVTIYFTDELTCTSTLNEVSPVLPAVTTMGGGAVYCVGDPVNDILVDVTGNGPWTLDYTLDGVAQSMNSATSTINLGALEGEYILTNISDLGCTNSAIGTETIIIQDVPTVEDILGGGTYCDGDLVNDIYVNLTGTAPWTLDYTLNGSNMTATGTLDSLNLGNAPGSYVITGITDAGCSNAASGNQTIIINTLPNVIAGNDFISCDGDQIALTGSGALQYDWDNGVVDGIAFVPGTTTTYTVTGTDVNGCVNTDNITVTVEPLPVVSFVADSLLGCEPHLVVFENTTIASSALADCIWNFNGGTVQQESCDTAVVEFESGGLYDVSLTTTTINGCTSSATYVDYIYVEDVPDASFTSSSTTVLSLNTEVFFTNTSTGAVTYVWNFGDSTAVETGFSPSHEFPETASTGYPVTLYAYSPIGCMDSSVTVILVKQETIFYIPNSFTPDGDEFNQTFQPVFTAGYDPFDFNLLIFNRWGEVIWESNDASVGWDGTYNGEIVPAGGYTWKLEFKTEHTDAREMHTGHVNILK